MIFGSATEILVCTRAAALLCSVPVIGAAVRPTPPALFLITAVGAACVRIVPSYPLGSEPAEAIIGRFRAPPPAGVPPGDPSDPTAWGHRTGRMAHNAAFRPNRQRAGQPSDTGTPSKVSWTRVNR
ncbi:hypothetical protein GCM10010166_57840 [Couchioplanes caeruleus subsp. azureus]|nr:hypothetical protein GCM10010166_57840 [Couchioplanes caeruleus subsp. azureus]